MEGCARLGTGGCGGRLVTGAARSLEELRAIARLQGVEPDDADLAAVREFLSVFLPAAGALSQGLAPGGGDPGAVPAGRAVSVAVARRDACGRASSRPSRRSRSALDRIEALDGALNAFITVRGEEALAEAEIVAGSRRSGARCGACRSR